MTKVIAFLIITLILSGCTKEEEVITTTTTVVTTIPITVSTIKTTSTGFPRLKPVLSEITLSADGTFNGTLINTAAYPIRLLGVTGQCRFQYNKSQIAPYNRFEINGKYCKLLGGVGERYAMPMDITYLVLTPGPVNRYVDHGTLRGSIANKNG